MKGLLRGIRYISQMFDEKEPEMQIGLPTDVKHVAHIGMDGPSANKPSWMTEYSAAPELSSAPMNSNNQQAEPVNSNQQVEPSASANGSLPPLGNNEKPKKSRRKASISSSPVGSPKGSEKPSRRHRSSNVSMDSPSRDSSSHGRRNRNKSRGGSDSASQSQEQIDIPTAKKSERKKTKGTSRSKGQNSLPDLTEIET